MRFLLCATLAALAIVPIASAIPENPGGTQFDVVGCTGVYSIDTPTFKLDCVTDEIDITGVFRVNGVVIDGVDTSALTECTGDQSYRGDGSCTVPNDTAHTTDTNAASKCGAGRVLLGNTPLLDGTCYLLTDIQNHPASSGPRLIVGVSTSTTAEPIYEVLSATMTFSGLSMVISPGTDGIGYFVEVSTPYVVAIATNAIVPLDNVFTGTNTFEAELHANTTIYAQDIITTAKITADNLEVTIATITVGYVTSAHITESYVTTANIADGYITTATIVESFVTTATIDLGIITTAVIANLQLDNLIVSSITFDDGFQILTVDGEGFVLPMDDDEVMVLSKVGTMANNTAIAYVLTIDGSIVGFIATQKDGSGEQSFYIGESEDPTDGYIRFRGTGAGGFIGDIDIIASDDSGSAVHIKGGVHTHIQGNLFMNGILGLPDSNHGGGCNGRCTDLLCIKSNGGIGLMNEAGGSLSGVCN